MRRWLIWLYSLPAAAGCIEVRNDTLTIADLAQAVPAFATAPQQTVIGLAPLPGAVRTFSAEALARFAARHSISLPEPRDVCFAWPIAPLTKDHVAAALKAAAPEAEVHVVDFLRSPVPPGRLELSAPPVQAKPGVPVVWRGRYRYGTSRALPFWVKALVSLPPAAVQRGQTVDVIVHAGAAQLRLQAKAITSGGPGAPVVVRNLASGRTFSAKVTGAGQALVEP